MRLPLVGAGTPISSYRSVPACSSDKDFMPNLGLPDQILLSGPFHAGPTLRVPGFISGGPDAEAPVAFFRSKIPRWERLSYSHHLNGSAKAKQDA